MLEDEGMETEQVFVGSMNFTRAGLDTNREMGLIVSDKRVTVDSRRCFGMIGRIVDNS